MMMMVMELPGFTPTPLNKLLGNWGKAHRLKAHDREIIGTAWKAHGYPNAEGLRVVHLFVILGPNQRVRDPDSMWKSTLDALVQCGGLKNDSPKWVRTGLVRFARAEEPMTFITLEDT